MIQRVPQLIAWLSTLCALMPGDVISCGTDRRGAGLMQDGELTTIEIDRIGTMQVRTHDPMRRSWPGAGVGSGAPNQASTVNGRVG
jgi:hypothetical protein